MKCLVFLNTLFLLLSIPSFSQRQYSTYQKDGYVGLEFVETHTKITLPIYEKITPLLKTQYEKIPSSIYNEVYIDNKKGFSLVCSNHSWSSIYSDNDIHFWKIVKDGKCGIINKEGVTIVPALYDDILGLIDTNFVLISKDSKTGVVHKNGTILIAPVYDRIVYSENSDGHFILKAYSGTNFSLINETGTILSTFPATLDADIQENHVILTNKYSQLKGASTLYGQEILPLVYDELDLSFNIFSFKKDEEAGLMDLTGKRFFSRSSNRIFHIKDNRNIIDISYKSYQLIDNTGATLCTDTFSTVAVHTNFMIVKIKSTGKFGILSFDGKMIVPATYQSLSVWNEMLVAKKEKKYGIINTSGNILLSFRYELITGLDDPSYILVKQKGKYGCIDKQLQTVLPFKYQQLYYIYYANGNTGSQEAVRIVSVKGTTKGVVAGVIDLHGNIKIPYKDAYFIGKKNEKYDPKNPISFRSDYLYCEKIINPVDKARDCIILDKDMQEILRCYSRTPRVYDDYFLFARIDRKYGMIAADGVILIPFIYGDLYPLGNNHIVAQKDRYVGLLSRSGKTQLAFQYNGLRYFSDEYILARDTNSISSKSGLIDYTGKIKIPFLYNSLSSDDRFNTSFLIARKDSLYGVIDLNENAIIPFEYENVKMVGKTFFHVEKNGKQGLVDTSNKIIIPIIYEHVNFINENRIWVSNNNLFGVLSIENQIIIPIEYEDIYYKNTSWRSNNYKIFEIKKAGKIGLIDLNGNVILPTEFNSIDCDGDTYRVRKDSMYYFAHASVINYNEPYEEISRMENRFRIKKNGKYGVVNYKGDVLIEPVYDEVDYFSHRGIVVKKNGQEATFDIYGKMIVPFK